MPLTRSNRFNAKEQQTDMLELGVCYYPEQWPREKWEEDARRMVELGLAWVRIGEFAWAKIEPRSGEFHWEWLDDAIEVLGNAGLKVILGTPTAAPPKWLIDRNPDILPVDVKGVVRKFGARRHYCFSSRRYRIEAARISEAMAERYGKNTFVHAWQTDNEYGDHDTIYSYSDEALRAFREWLEVRYGTVEELNRAWGTAFWAMNYLSFDEVELPNNLVEEPSPTHIVDYIRFSSDQVKSFNKAQVDIIRKHSPGRPVTHNFMSQNTDFDHYKVGEDIDIASWDVYPMGGLLNGRLVGRQGPVSARRRSGPTGLQPRPLPRRRQRPRLGDGATAGPGELGLAQPVAGRRHGSPLDLACLCPWRRYGLPISAGGRCRSRRSSSMPACSCRTARPTRAISKSRRWPRR